MFDIGDITPNLFDILYSPVITTLAKQYGFRCVVNCANGKDIEG